MCWIKQRFNDWRLERCIERLASEGIEAYGCGNRDLAKIKFRLMAEATGRRSQAQIARMHKRAGVGRD